MPAGLKFVRKLGTTWVFGLTWLDRNGDRQQLTGWSTQKAFWRTLDDDTLLDTDTSGFTLDETADPATYGDFTYRRAVNDQAEFAAGGTFRLDFEVSLNSEVVPAPEENYIVVEVKA